MLIVPIKMCQENWEFWHKVGYLRFKIARPGLASSDLKKKKAHCTVFLPTFHLLVKCGKNTKKHARIYSRRATFLKQASVLEHILLNKNPKYLQNTKSAS